MVGEQCLFALLQLESAWVVFRQTRQLDLHADELAARVAAVLQPVGVDQPQAVVVRLVDDCLEESFFVAHRTVLGPQRIRGQRRQYPSPTPSNRRKSMEP